MGLHTRRFTATPHGMVVASLRRLRTTLVTAALRVLAAAAGLVTAALTFVSVALGVTARDTGTTDAVDDSEAGTAACGHTVSKAQLKKAAKKAARAEAKRAAVAASAAAGPDGLV